MRIIKSFNQKGFTLVEIMVVAGLVSGLSLAIMQMTKNASQVSKKMSQDIEIEGLTNEIRSALRESQGCMASLGTYSLTGAAPLGTGVGTQIDRIFRVQNGLNMRVASRVNTENEYARQTPGAFTITDIRLMGFLNAVPSNAFDSSFSTGPLVNPFIVNILGVPENRLSGRALLRIFYRKGHANSAAAIQAELSAGSTNLTRDITLELTVRAAGKQVLACATDQTSYVASACQAMRGVLDPLVDGGLYCKGIDIAAEGSPAQDIASVATPLIAATFQTNKSDSIIRIINQTLGGGTREIVSTGTGSGAGAGKLSIGIPGISQMVITNAGDVGIGTTNPLYRLQVTKTSLTQPAMMIGGAFAGGPRIQTYGLDADPLAFMGLGTDMSGGPYENSIYTSGPAQSGKITFGQYNGTTFTERMRVHGNGNVGIGTTAPGYPLDVTGSLRTSGELISTGPGFGQARFINGNYGVIQRNDGSNFYTLVTAPGDQYGSWNTFRPFSFSLSTGNVGLGGVAGTDMVHVTGNIDTNQSAAMIGPVGSNINRYVTKDWVTAALTGSLASGWNDTQKSAIIGHIINAISGTAPYDQYDVLRDAIKNYTLGIINVDGTQNIISACGGNQVMKGLRYNPATGTFQKYCLNEVNPPDCTIEGNCSKVFSNDLGGNRSGFCKNNGAGADICLTTGLGALGSSCSFRAAGSPTIGGGDPDLTKKGRAICPAGQFVVGVEQVTGNLLCCTIGRVNLFN